jgi:hypothetical protein
MASACSHIVQHAAVTARTPSPLALSLMNHARAPCARVAQVAYCSAECQKAHWKEGGHKKQCKALLKEGGGVPISATSTKVAGSARAPTAAGTTARKHQVAGSARAPTAAGITARKHPATKLRATPTPVAVAGGSDAGACVICLDLNPPPIQSGCACRGDAGLAHVECRISAATHKHKSSADIKVWQVCPTCGQMFQGAMGLCLAKELLRRSIGRREKVEDWCYAATILATALNNAGKSAEAEVICRETMADFHRMGLRASKLFTIQLLETLCGTLTNQGKLAEAQTIQENCVKEYIQLVGLDHALTIQAGMNLGNILNRQRKSKQAEVILRDYFERAKRVLGLEHALTLQCWQTYANVLCNQGKDEEATAAFQELLPAMRRVLGPDHPLTLKVGEDYAFTLSNAGRYAEGETILVERAAAQKRLLGAGHPNTRRTIELLSIYRAHLPK